MFERENIRDSQTPGRGEASFTNMNEEPPYGLIHEALPDLNEGPPEPFQIHEAQLVGGEIARTVAHADDEQHQPS